MHPRETRYCNQLGASLRNLAGILLKPTQSTLHCMNTALSSIVVYNLCA